MILTLGTAPMYPNWRRWRMVNAHGGEGSVPAIVGAWLVCIWVLGCAVVDYDQVAGGASKGYVDFYPDGEPGAGGIGAIPLPARPWQIWKQENGNLVRVTGILWSGSQRRRIADSPGRHTYIIKLGTAVEVKEGLMTRCEFSQVTGWKHYFVMTVEVEKPIPVSAE